MDKSEFTSAEVIDGPFSSRVTRTFSNGDEWIREVARKGRDDPAFVSVGWWRPGDGGERTAACMMPWLWFDIDLEEDLLRGRDLAQGLVEELLEMGFSESHTFASFSGNKGWHVQTSTAPLGLPFFRTTRHARNVWNDFLRPLKTQYELDPNVFSPLSIIRLTNSRHEKSGNLKWTLGARDFLRHTDETEQMLRMFYGDRQLVMEQVRGSGILVSDFSDPRSPERDDDLAGHFAEVWKKHDSGGLIEKGASKPRSETTKQNAYGDYVTMSSSTYKAFQGVSKSAEFAPGLHGREIAAFCLACHWCRCGHSGERVLDLLRKWDRQRNKPPLQNDPDEANGVLKQKVNSAMRATVEDGERAEPDYLKRF